MSARVLFVDDQPLELLHLSRALRGRHEVVLARSAEAALELVAEGPAFAVVVTDMRMPGMDGVDLLQELQTMAPDTVRIMLTGAEDQLAAVEALNSGQAFRFLTKPCSGAALAAAVDAAVRQHELATASRVLLEQTLAGSVQLLVDLLSVFDPKAFGQAQQVRDHALAVGARLGLTASWDLGLAALLAPVGRMALPLPLQAKLNWSEAMSPAEAALVARIPETAAAIVATVPRLQPVARILRYAGKAYDGGGFPDEDVRGAQLPMESRILHTVQAFAERNQARRSRAVVLEELRLAEGEHDPNVLAALGQVLDDPARGRSEGERIRLRLRDLRPGQHLAEDLVTGDGALVLAAGTRLAQVHLDRLRGMDRLTRLQEDVLVES